MAKFKIEWSVEARLDLIDMDRLLTKKANFPVLEGSLSGLLVENLRYKASIVDTLKTGAEFEIHEKEKKAKAIEPTTFWAQKLKLKALAKKHIL